MIEVFIKNTNKLEVVYKLKNLLVHKVIDRIKNSWTEWKFSIVVLSYANKVQE